MSILRQASLALLLCAALAVLSETALAQPKKYLPPDSVRLRYNFKKGEKVLYRVVSVDTIALFGVPPRILARERVDLVEIRCDAVVDEGFVLTSTLRGYAATESYDKLPPVLRDTSEWLGRSTTFLMTPDGTRKGIVESPTTPAVASGGPFQPLLLPYLGEEESYVGSSRTMDNKQWLVENVYPPVWWAGTTLRTISRRVDTLGEKGLMLAYSDVGRTTYEPEGTKTSTLSVVNGAGDFIFASSRGYTIGGSYELLAKLTITSEKGQTMDGRHKIRMFYEEVKEEPEAGGKPTGSEGRRTPDPNDGGARTARGKAK